MKEFTSLIFTLLALYLVILILLYLFQRSMIYFPVAPERNFDATEISLDSEGHRLHGWILNPGRRKALLYFGGNAERVTYNRALFESLFHDHSVYLVDYRGYGNSGGSPSEAALFADALAIYDYVAPAHDTVTAFGRSLGSGVAVYLATQRSLDRLILLTPYDSLAEVAQRAYPIFPAKWLIKDRFDSVSRAAEIRLPVLIMAAERDRIVPPEHARELARRLVSATVRFFIIENAGHNDVTEYPAFRETLLDFIY